MMITQLPKLFLAAECTGQTILPDLYDGLRVGGSCEVQITKLSQILVLVGNAISIMMFIAAIVAIGFIIAGGFMYIASSGEPANIKKAKETIVNAVVGLVISMLAFGVVKVITAGF